MIMAPASARAAGVVGSGTAASCTDAALNGALAGGGRVTFNCGGPVELDVSRGSGTKTITADTAIDGGGQTTIRAFEFYALDRYGLDSVTLWARLLGVT